MKARVRAFIINTKGQLSITNWGIASAVQFAQPKPISRTLHNPST